MTLLGTLKVDISKTKPKQVFQNDKNKNLTIEGFLNIWVFKDPKPQLFENSNH